VKARVESARSTLNQHVRLSLALLGLAVAVLVLFVSGSGAVLAPSTFEGNDGDMIHTGSNTDWDNVHGGATTLTDKSSDHDNSFTQGTKENDVNVTIDLDHSVPSKDDILKSYVASETVGTNTFLYLAWQRLADTGDAHIDFELNQAATSGWTDTSTSVTLNRTVGDLLISYDFSGSGVPTITSFTWDGSAWTNQTDLTAGGFAEAGVNTAGPIPDPISGGTIPQLTFGEASIDLNKVPGTKFTQDICEAFGSILVKTRSSGSGGTAALKDFILPVPIHVSNCGAITIHKEVPGTDAQSFSFTGSGTDASVAAASPFSLADNGTAGADTKSFPAIKPGTYNFDETPIPAGWKLASPAVTCTASGDGTSAPTSQDTGPLAITLGASGTVDCTYHNVKKTGTIEVKKVLSPSTNTGRFDLTIGSTKFDNSAAGYGDGGTTTAQTLTLGNYAVSESGHSGTNLSQYTSTYSCTKNGSPLTSGSGTSVPSGVTLAADGDAIVCTFTNTFIKRDSSVATVVKDGQNVTVTNAAPAALGSAVHDTATLGAAVGGFPQGDGSSSAPNGATVTYQLFTTNDCTGTHSDQTVNVAADGSVPDSNAQTLGAGSYSYKAVYSGNQYYNGSTGDCEPFKVSQATPTLVTTVKDGQGATVDNDHPAALGTAIHDTSTLDGAVDGFKLGDGTTSAPDGATVTYELFSTNDCTGAHVDQQVAVAADGSVPNATALTLSPGMYSYLAVYSGNKNYTAKTAACEPFKVNQATPTLVTTVKDGQNVTVTNAAPAALGSAVHDTATLGGAVGSFKLGDGTTAPPDGATVTYQFFTTNDCTGTHTDQTVTVAADGSVPNSSAQTLAAGSYSYLAVYSGNKNYTAKTADCEPFAVAKPTPTLVTTVKDGQNVTVTNAAPAALGTAVHDTAALGGSVGSFPLGGASDPATVTYEFFTTNDCTGSHSDEVVNVAADGSVPNASAKTLGAGSYSYLAIYSGNNNYNSKTAACEPFKVSQVTPTLVTTVKDGQNATVTNAAPAPLGTAVHDTATLDGSVAGFTLGGGATVTYEFFTTNDCTGSHTDQVVNVATDGSVPNASAQTLAAGSYSYLDVYSGNANYAAKTADCEPFKVTKATPTLVTTVKDGQNVTVTNAAPAALGTAVHDTATLGGAVDSFTLADGATVTYEFFTTNDCTGSHTDQVVNVAANGSVPDANAQTLGAGMYSYLAVYSGNSNYNSKTADCEPFKVNQAQLAMATKVHNADHVDVTGQSVGLGSTVHDLSIVTGGVTGFAPTGAVSFVLYGDSNCQLLPQTVAADGMEDGNVRSVGVMMLVPGNYGFKATVAGDANYLGQTGACEPFSVAQATTTTVTAIHNANHDVVTTVALGTTVHDAATVTSTNSTAKPTGNVNFTFYTNSNCTGEGTSAGSHALDANGIADPSSPEGPLAAGSYGFKATYVGDVNFVGSTGECEPLTVTKGTPTTATTLHNASSGAVVENGSHLPIQSGLYDVATLSGGSGFPFSGTVTFEFFNNSTCTGTPASTQTGVSVSGSTAQSSTHSNLNAGNYAFDAKYVAGANDPNHNDSAISGCEPFTIDKAAPTIATTLSAVEVQIASNVHDSAKLTGASSNAGGSVTYTVFDNNTCATNANTRDAGTVAVTNGNVPDSNEVLFNTAGDFYWQAAYSGDANNLAATSLCTSEHLVVDRPAIAITKNPAAQSVNSGGTASFTITVTNTGTVTLTNVTVTDPLSTGCAKTIGTLTPGQSTSYTCTQDNVTAPYTNVATATGHPPVGPDVTASASARVEINQPPSSPPSTPTPTPTVDLAIVKTADPTSTQTGKNVTYTLTVTNNGPVTDTNVVVGDSLPFGVSFVSATSTQGTCTGTTVVQCSIGTMTVGQKVTITIVVNTTNTGTIVNTATVVGALPETTLTNNTSSATINVTAPPAPKPAPKPVFKPPVVKPAPKPVPPPCYAVVVAPKQLTVGKSGTLRLVVTAKNKAIAGVKIEVKGAGILKLSNRTDKSGHVTINLHPKKSGIVLVKPASYKGCTNPRIGVIGAFTPPVTG
jgi:uncharacterized repeat protein (TIGR01451 family)